MTSLSKVAWPENLLRRIFANDDKYILTDDKINFISKTLDEILKVHLTDRQFHIIMHRHKDMMSLAEAGEKFAITREKARQIENKALKLLKSNFRKQCIFEGIVNPWSGEIDGIPYNSAIEFDKIMRSKK